MMVSGIRSFSMFLALALVVAACGQAAPSPADITSTSIVTSTSSSVISTEPSVADGGDLGDAGCEQSHEVTVGFQVTGLMAILEAAEGEGFDEENCLEINSEILESGPLIQAALERGDVDIILTVTSSGLAARQQGADMVVILQAESVRSEAPDTLALLVRPDASILSIADLAGKTIAVGNLGGQSTISLQIALNRAGIELDEVNLVEAGFPTHFDLMETGQVDGVVTLNPFLTRIEQADLGEALLYPYLEVGLQGGPLGSWWSLRDWAEENREAIEAFVSTMVATTDFLVSNPDQARAYIASYTGLERSLVDDMLLINWNTVPDVDAWERTVELLLDGDVLTEYQSPDDYWYSTMWDLAEEGSES